MQRAITEDGVSIKPEKTGKAYCPACKSLVIAKCGQINIWHWSHEKINSCDWWKQKDPKTKWHLDWQNLFHIEDTEVIIRKDNQYHIADIVGNNDVVIEIQNSPLPADEIIERERFYEKLIWVINGRQFANNLEFSGNILNTNIDSKFLEKYIYWQDDSSDRLKQIIITVPEDDDGSILDCLRKQKKIFTPDKHHSTIWYILDPEAIDFNIPSDLKSAFVAFDLNHQVETKKKFNVQVSFWWLFPRRSWVKATMPIFIDFGKSFLIYLKNMEASGYCTGRIISKNIFLEKYRRRAPVK